MKKIISIVGARPNFIKLAALSTVLEKHFDHVIIHTGQHYDYGLSQNFFDELLIQQPNYNLSVGSQDRHDQISKIRKGCEKILIKEKPDIVMIYGDTNSSLGGAEAAFETKIPIAHVEAGVRCFDDTMPEEINRKTIDKISNILFCPTEISIENLRSEGVVENVYLVGDTMHDALLRIKLNLSILKVTGVKPKKYYFATIHRQKNTNHIRRLEILLKVFSKLDKKVIFPLHPRTKKVLLKLKNNFKNINLIEPLNFGNSISLQKHSKMILTDSGGVQKEAYYLKVPCLTLRNTTEWPETVKSGWNKLVDDDENKILYYSKKFVPPKRHPSYFGKGHVAPKIINILKEYLYDK